MIASILTDFLADASMAVFIRLARGVLKTGVPQGKSVRGGTCTAQESKHKHFSKLLILQFYAYGLLTK